MEVLSNKYNDHIFENIKHLDELEMNIGMLVNYKKY